MKKILKTIFVLVAIICVFALSACSDYIPRALPSNASSSGDSATSSDSSTSDTGTSTSGGSSTSDIGSSSSAISGSSVFIEGRNVQIYTKWCCDHEVTQAEYKAIMGSVPSGQASTDGDADNNPVNCVSWYDALVYCNKRSKIEGFTPCYTISGTTDPASWGSVPTDSREASWNAVTCDFEANGYRLPTEAEWEHFARGERKETYEYSGSDDVDEVAWYKDNSSDKTHEVRKKKPNGAGLYDMSGNVWEWCWDWYGSISTSTLSTGPASGSGRVIRGGSWGHYANRATVAGRLSSFPNSRHDDIGFRVVRTVE